MNKLKTLSFLLILLLIPISVSAQKKTSVDLPMKMRGLMPAVEVMVNGKGPFCSRLTPARQEWRGWIRL